MLHRTLRLRGFRLAALALAAALLVPSSAGALASSGAAAHGTAPGTASAPSPPSGQALPGDASQQPAWLAELNALREAMGLRPLRADDALTRAAQGHARYIALNHLLDHFQQPGRPGFTGVAPAERVAGAGYSGEYWGEVAATKAGALPGPVGIWVDAPYHRLILLDPDAEDAGFWVEPLRGAENYHAAVLNLGRRSDYWTGTHPDIVVYPYDGQEGVPVSFHRRERPDPRRFLPGHPAESGYVISIQLPLVAMDAYGATFAGALYTPDGQKVPATLLDVRTDPFLQPGRALLVPHKPLQPGTRYTVRFQGEYLTGRGAIPWERTWSFTTAPADPPPGTPQAPEAANPAHLVTDSAGPSVRPL